MPHNKGCLTPTLSETGLARVALPPQRTMPAARRRRGTPGDLAHTAAPADTRGTQNEVPTDRRQTDRQRARRTDRPTDRQTDRRTTTAARRTRRVSRPTRASQVRNPHTGGPDPRAICCESPGHLARIGVAPFTPQIVLPSKPLHDLRAKKNPPQQLPRPMGRRR